MKKQKSNLYNDLDISNKIQNLLFWKNEYINFDLKICKRLRIISNTNFKKILVNNTKEKYLFSAIESEYSWIFGDIYPSFQKICEINKNVCKNFENEFILYKDNSKTNKSPDFVFWNIKTGIKIGIETTQPFIPSTKVFYKINDKNDIKNYLKKESNFIEKHNKEFNILTKTLEILNNKIRKINNWEFVNIKIIIINIPYDKMNIEWKDNIEYKDLYFLLKISEEIKKYNKNIIAFISHTENNFNNWEKYLDINFLIKNILN
ncbi:hypothetical protein [Candidatus Hepatoplasma crinochetorum]|uniref:hypothetical protein n=1 Tax=Candidatus Hepatoplasma crinochetorum TaxID=295596 RepID=UPI003087D092|nr:MAG: hypothetical protein HCTKY_5160 [Candidatus Hepatoplasma crinochetorum]